MKKTYLSPSVEIININGATHLMSASGINIISDDSKKVNTSADGGSAQLGRDNIGSSNVWDQEW